MACPKIQAQFPERPVDIIVPFGAGGGSDVFVRILQKAIRENELSPQPFVIRNVGGAGGTIGSRRALGAVPDGHTLLCLHDGIYTARHYGTADWGPADFEPIAATGRSGVVVAVAEGSPYATLLDLMEDAKQRPYRVVCGTNLGAPSHYSALFLQEGMPGARFRFTQSGGGAKRLAQLKGGHVEVTGFSISEFVQFKGAGIRALAVLNEERVPALPDLPTARELGVNVIDSLIQFWWAPKGTPPDRVQFFSEVLRQTMNTPEVRERLMQLHIEPLFLTGKDLDEVLEERGRRLEKLVVEPPVGVPPLEWVVLAFVAICGGLVWREGTPTDGANQA
ncbi:MAG: tripartite tricarboxylate transporter substrate binding protein [Verrucomicrobiota bacterium]